MSMSVVSQKAGDGVAAPLGVFDSGIGGLTVAAALMRRLPGESLTYLGDTARVPYGTKSPEVIRRYALRCSQFLVEQGAKLVVIACNTASAAALDVVRATIGTPVVGVIEPGAELAARTTKNGRVGVIGTESTINSGSYQRALAALDPRIEVFTAPCPLFVPLAEEGLAGHHATRLLAEEYLRPLVASGIDTLVLGCTHYPLLVPVIADVCGSGVAIVNSADAVAEAVAAQVGAACVGEPRHRFYATDVGERVKRVGGDFLGSALAEVELG
ncbi:MAG TPA: glutamate racemase, partial [Myxococcota bacterium]|nr:glutamate racemase [Myxococcota bacterium]